MQPGLTPPDTSPQLALSTGQARVVTAAIRVAVQSHGLRSADGNAHPMPRLCTLTQIGVPKGEQADGLDYDDAILLASIVI